MKYSYILILAFSSMLFVLGVGCEDGDPSGPETEDVDVEVTIASAIDNPWYYEGDTLQLEWTASADPAEGFEVLLSTDTGMTFSIVSEGVLSPDTRSYRYLVTDAVAPRALLKVRAKNGVKPAEAVSDTLTQNMNIRITTNLAGKVFSHDDNISVEWVADTNWVTNGFLVDISWNRGQDFSSVIMDESLPMDVTSARVLFKTNDNGEPIDSDQCIIRVHEYDYKENNDITGPFTLRP